MHKIKTVGKRIAADLYQYRWAILALFLYDLAATRLFGAFCPMVILTGLPCPGCGMTRAAFLILTGQWALATRYNPAVWIWLAVGLYFAWNRYGKGRRAAGVLYLAGGAALVMTAVYFYRMAVCFPGEAPMVFGEDNLLGKILPFYNEVLRKLFGI